MPGQNQGERDGQLMTPLDRLHPRVCKAIFGWLLVLTLNEAGAQASTEPRQGLSAQEYERTMYGQLASLDLQDGVDAAEARVIFEAYEYRHFFCHSRGQIEDGGDAWLGVVLDHWGQAAPAASVRIDKRSGAVHSTLGPEVTDPRTLLEPAPAP